MYSLQPDSGIKYNPGQEQRGWREKGLNISIVCAFTGLNGFVLSGARGPSGRGSSGVLHPQTPPLEPDPPWERGLNPDWEQGSNPPWERGSNPDWEQG